MEGKMAADVKANLQKTDSWFRVLYMVLFFLFSKIAIFIMGLIILFQGIFFLLTAKPNEKVKVFSLELNDYIKELFAYMIFDIDKKPFPFTDWPGKGKTGSLSTSTSSKPVVKKSVKKASKKAAKKSKR